MTTYTRIASLKNQVEASLLDSILSERGVDHAIITFHDSAFDGMFEMNKGWGAVEAPTEAREEILELLEALRAEASKNIPS